MNKVSKGFDQYGNSYCITGVPETNWWSVVVKTKDGDPIYERYGINSRREAEKVCEWRYETYHKAMKRCRAIIWEDE